MLIYLKKRILLTNCYKVLHFCKNSRKMVLDNEIIEMLMYKDSKVPFFVTRPCFLLEMIIFV